jgi:hypothetical protein
MLTGEREHLCIRILVKAQRGEGFPCVPGRAAR